MSSNLTHNSLPYSCQVAMLKTSTCQAGNLLCQLSLPPTTVPSISQTPPASRALAADIDFPLCSFFCGRGVEMPILFGELLRHLLLRDGDLVRAAGALHVHERPQSSDGEEGFPEELSVGVVDVLGLADATLRRSVNRLRIHEP